MSDKSKANSKTSQVNLDEATRTASLFASADFVELLQNRRKFAWLNFRAGIYRGLGGVVGAALAIVLIGYLVVIFGGVPWIGNFINDINDSVPKPTAQPSATVK